jgi:protein gp37
MYGGRYRGNGGGGGGGKGGETMIKNSPIEWTGATWNWIQGCVKKTIEIDGQVKLREECRNCYMYRDKLKYGQKPQIVVRSNDPTFYKPLKLQREVEQGKRPDFQDRLVFTCSWSDHFNPEGDDWRPEAWDIIRRCPDLIFQILTKLPQRMNDHLPSYWDEIKGRCWVGVTGGYQEAADEMREYLRAIDAPHKFVSYEPALGPVNWDGWQGIIDWLIAGGESGPEARPTHLNWLRQARNWAIANGVAFHFKQWGEFVGGLGQRTGWVDLQNGVFVCGDKNTHEWSDGYISQRVGKHNAGRLLDGVEWSQFPTLS